MKLKKLLRVCLVGSLVITTLCCSSTTSASVDYTSKIDSALAEKLNQIGSNDTVDVSIWLNDIGGSTIERAVSYSIANNVECGNIKQKIADLHAIDIRNPDKVKEFDKDLSVRDVQRLTAIERDTKSRVYQEYNLDCIENADILDEINESDITYVSAYLPNLEATLTKNEVYTLAESEDVDSIFIKGQIDCYEDETEPFDDIAYSSNYHLNWQEITGIEEARTTYGLDGTGIKVGQIESMAINPNEDLFSYAVENGTLHTYEGNVYDSSTASHADYTASIIIGKSDEYIAAVPNVDFYSISSNSTVWKEKIERLLEDGVNIINASTYYLGNETLGEYGDSSKWIEQISTIYNVTIFISSGNQGQNDNYLTRGAMSYNAIAVGNLNEYNTANTADDTIVSTFLSNGAYKPDIVAPGSYVGTGINPTMTGGGTSAAAPVATSVAVQLCQRCPGLLLNPQFLKAILLNGATYLGSNNEMNSTNNEFVAFDRKSGAGIVNTLKSMTCYATRGWDFGTSDTTQASYKLLVDSRLKQVHITVCSLKDVLISDEDATPTVNPHATYRITVTRDNNTWVSECNTDNKCSLIFDPPSKGRYNVVIERTDGNSSSIRTAVVYTSC